MSAPGNSEIPRLYRRRDELERRRDALLTQRGYSIPIDVKAWAKLKDDPAICEFDQIGSIDRRLRGLA